MGKTYLGVKISLSLLLGDLQYVFKHARIDLICLSSVIASLRS